MPATDPDKIPDEYKPSSLPLAKDHRSLDSIASIKYLQEEIYAISLSKGFWDDHDELYNAIAQDSNLGLKQGARLMMHVNLLYKISRTMLVVTELAEGVEALRLGDHPDDKVPQFSGFTVELADAFIRILDIATRFKLPLAEAVIKKISFNKKRSHKHGGKSI